jgi:hypothetical protein
MAAALTAPWVRPGPPGCRCACSGGAGHPDRRVVRRRDPGDPGAGVARAARARVAVRAHEWEIRRSSRHATPRQPGKIRPSPRVLNSYLTVPFTNNQAECDLRPATRADLAKSQPQISGCHRSQTGARAGTWVRGYISPPCANTATTSLLHSMTPRSANPLEPFSVRDVDRYPYGGPTACRVSSAGHRHATSS